MWESEKRKISVGEEYCTSYLWTKSSRIPKLTSPLTSHPISPNKMSCISSFRIRLALTYHRMLQGWRSRPRSMDLLARTIRCLEPAGRHLRRVNGVAFSPIMPLKCPFVRLEWLLSLLDLDIWRTMLWKGCFLQTLSFAVTVPVFYDVPPTFFTMFYITCF